MNSRPVSVGGVVVFLINASTALRQIFIIASSDDQMVRAESLRKLDLGLGFNGIRERQDDGKIMWIWDNGRVLRCQ